MTSLSIRRLSLAVGLTLIVAATGAMSTAQTEATKVAMTALGPGWDCWHVAWMTSCTQARAMAMPPKHAIPSGLPEA